MFKYNFLNQKFVAIINVIVNVVYNNLFSLKLSVPTIWKIYMFSHVVVAVRIGADLLCMSISSDDWMTSTLHVIIVTYGYYELLLAENELCLVFFMTNMHRSSICRFP
jgi:hypothetical protein